MLGALLPLSTADGVTVTQYTCILEIPGSNLVVYIGCPVLLNLLHIRRILGNTKYTTTVSFDVRNYSSFPTVFSTHATLHNL
jgi:hypothetical protein